MYSPAPGSPSVSSSWNSSELLSSAPTSQPPEGGGERAPTRPLSPQSIISISDDGEPVVKRYSDF